MFPQTHCQIRKINSDMVAESRMKLKPKTIINGSDHIRKLFYIFTKRNHSDTRTNFQEIPTCHIHSRFFFFFCRITKYSLNFSQRLKIDFLINYYSLEHNSLVFSWLGTISRTTEHINEFLFEIDEKSIDSLIIFGPVLINTNNHK